jgi:acetylglutamate kinase
MIDGRRITDAQTLKIVQMVYAGLINKNIVAQLQARKNNSIGLTGADSNAVLATKRIAEIDYGFVGDVKKVNADKISLLLNSGLIPVIAPLTHDGRGQMLNTNADTIAAAVAATAASKYNTTLIYCFEKSGVLKNIEDKNSVIENINSKEYAQLKAEGIISKGMIPKLDNAFDAIKKKVNAVVLCHANDLLKVVSTKPAGTRLEK